MTKKHCISLIFTMIMAIVLSGCNVNDGEKFDMDVAVIPLVKESKLKGKGMSFDATVKTNEDYTVETEVFCQYAQKLGIDITIGAKGSITLFKEDSLEKGAYKMEVGSSGVKLYAGDRTGMSYAFATLLQIMEKSENGKVNIPLGTISDSPDSEYRGVMVDLARSWHDFNYLLKYVDMCYFYKISVLHLHFTDDQSYTLPSDLFPNLSTPDRHYSKEQITQLTEYARARGVEIMPEIDVPGHCTSFIKAYNRIFGNFGIICQHEESMQAMRNLFGELCDMFPYSQYIHIGGDEAAIMRWTECSKCKKYIATKGIDTSIEDKELLSEQMLANFVSEMAEAVFSKGRTPVAWEGFSKEVNHMVSKDIIMMSWENYYQLTPDLLEAGFKIINCSWNPMYIVAPGIQRDTQEVYDWSIYKWKPVHGGSPYITTGLEIEPNENVLGGQLLAWGDQIATAYPSVEEGVADEFELIKERIPYLAQNTWNIEKDLEYSEFARICEDMEEKLSAILNYS